MEYHASKTPILDEAYNLYKTRVKFDTHTDILRNKGAEFTNNIDHPYILDLLN